MSYDVAGVRGLYTSLSDGWIYLNAHDCPQVPERVSSAVARSFRTATAVSRPEPAAGSHAKPASGSPEGRSLLDDAAVAVADLVGATPERVVLGPGLPYLYSSLAAAMSPLLRRNSAVVLNNVDRVELTSALQRVDAKVSWAAADLATGALPGWQYMDLVDGTTRLVSVPAAHPYLGTVAPVGEIVETVRAASRAWVLVDASAYAPYRPIHFDEWNADIVAVDLKEMGGPEIAALVFRDEAMFGRLAPVGDPAAAGAARVGLGVSPGLAGAVAPTIDHYAALVDAPAGRASRRTRLVNSMTETSAYLERLRDELHTFLGTLPAVHIVGVSGEAAAESGAEVDRIPRLSFGVKGVPAQTVHQRLFAHGIVATLTPQCQLTEDMGVGDLGGAVTVSLGPFNTTADIEQLIRTVASLA
ncbi:aminotransferase class V-fold PLP-dependent enzyme [Corynebacterium qintianiae]|uniref:Aminotransferase class V-fold PLP-dependent enzyme n=1 Tax=Corynebacterium qintianiae TaxID=2709392 RepID=A0A7T0KN21_9CORY|nr:aminotransferase class V-fold PLP-dependent enzyme [Corynebacterium qintianiae]QPK83349.1 aminotransferase class V-fold PLP-dependent enzyme [Corynebacterium qintianiae]